MPAMEFLCKVVGVNPCHLTKEENLILEASLFSSICDQLIGFYKNQFNIYFQIIKHNLEKECVTIEHNLMRLIIQDLINSDESTLAGIATYTRLPEEVIYDIAIGKNVNPSLHVSRKIIELHRIVRCDLYKHIIDKISITKPDNQSSEFC